MCKGFFDYLIIDNSIFLVIIRMEINIKFKIDCLFISGK